MSVAPSRAFDCTAVDDLLAEIRLNPSLAADHLPEDPEPQPEPSHEREAQA